MSMSTSQAGYELAERVGLVMKDKGLWLATAESCTGGGIAAAVTDVPGSSAWFDRGFVTYSNAAKQELLGVDADTLTQHGAVSEAVVRAMASGALAGSMADVAVAVSGIAGPDGGTQDKPVGTVWIAWAWRNRTVRAEKFLFPGGRSAVREATVFAALKGILTDLASVDSRRS